MKFKKFKRAICISMTAAMMLGLVACGSTKGDTADNKGGDEKAVVELPAEYAGDAAGLTAEAVGTVVEAGPSTKDDNFGEASAASGAEVGNGEVIIEFDFENNNVEKFATYTTAGGNLGVSGSGGKMAVMIKSEGNLNYSDQVYYDGFALSQGCKYKLSFDVSCDITRPIEYRLQLNGGDYHAYVGDSIEIGPEMQTIEGEFEMKDPTDPAPRLAFNLGIAEGMEPTTPSTEGADPETGEYKIYLDNIKVEVTDASQADLVGALPDYRKVAASQIGYAPGAVKTAFVRELDVNEFYICKADSKEVVYAGKFNEGSKDPATDAVVKQGDFTPLQEPGEYYVYTDQGTSYTFKIGDGIFTDLYKDSVLMLTRQRCGMAIDASIAGEKFAHPECHMQDATIYGTTEKKNVTGGWHDAGDYGRYVVAGVTAVADLLMAYEDFGISADDYGIPESGNGVPDILDEAKYELDWLLKMQDEKTGVVYHKVTGYAFPDAVMPEFETEEMVLAPMATNAIADFIAIMAKASVIYKDIDPEFSKAAMAAAEKSWDAIHDPEFKTYGFTNPKDITTGEYPDKNFHDELLWAAAELYLAGRDDLVDEVKTLKDHEDVNYALGWATIGLYPAYDLAKAKDADLAKYGKDIILQYADAAVEMGNKDGYKTALGYNYPWGSNMTVAKKGQLLYMANKLTDDIKYTIGARQKLDYLLGANPLGYCYVTGYGTFSPENPHHRPSQVAGEAMIGMLVGGPDKNLEDGYAKAVLTGQPEAMCYADNVQSFSTNEVTIYWNSPLIYLLAGEMQ